MRKASFPLFLLSFALFATSAMGQQAATPNAAVPDLINFSGTLTDLNGNPLTGVQGVTFLLYKEEQGGSPVWIETQNVIPGKNGKYTVTLGSTKLDASLSDSFANGEARWLGVQISGQEQQPRVLLVSVPYAMKAGDAETIGGLPPSAFVLANSGKQGTAGTAASTTSASASSKTSAPPANPTVTGKGVVGFVPMWDTTSDIVDSVMFQKSSQIGFGTTSPTATIDVNGKGNVRDTLTLFPKSTDNTLAVSGTAFKIGSTGTVTFISGQKFPGTGTITGVTTSSTSGLQGGGTTGTLNLSVKPAGVTNAMLQNSKITLNANTAGGLTTPGAMTLGSTFTIGLKPCSASQVLQFNGTSWACAAVGTGTITGVTAGSGLSGGGTSGNVTLNVKTAGVTNSMLQNSAVTVNPGADLTGGGSVPLGGSTTLNLDTTKVPLLSASNTFTGNQTVNGNLSATGVVTGSSYQIGNSLFAYGSYSNGNAFLGFAGNTATTGVSNTAIGEAALASNTTGYSNTASGSNALWLNTTGYGNTANGWGALQVNQTGNGNTATGFDALASNTAGGNTATGYQALSKNTLGDQNTAVGYQALYSNIGDTQGDGRFNAAFGYQALFSNTLGSSNTAVGDGALYSNTGDNTGLNGTLNAAFGFGALYANTLGYDNIAVGTGTLGANTLGYHNAAVGGGALELNTLGYQNTAVGDQALINNTTGNNLTCIGYRCDANGNIFNATAIGAHAVVEQSNSLVLGGTGEFAVKVGIGTPTPSNVLTIARGLGHPVSDSWETYSSRRWKTNIRPLHDALGAVEQLRGVSYDLRGSGKHEIGVIAEEVGAVVPELVTYEENGKDARSVDYSRLTALLIEGMKQQQKQIQQLKSQLRETRATVRRLKAQVEGPQRNLLAKK